MNEKLKNDIINAMKSKDSLRLGTLRLLKGAIQLEEINKKRELTDDEIVSIVSKQIKLRKDSIIEFEKASRTDSILKLNDEIDILKSYMPLQLDNDQINSIIDSVIEEVNASSISDLGNVMKILIPKVKGKADMSLVNEILKNKLK